MLQTLDAAAGAVTESELVERAYALLPVLHERATQCETDRHVSAQTIADLNAAGLFAIAKPKRYGGLELGWDTFCEITSILASACGSTGWVYGVVGGHSAVVARFGTDLMDEMWGRKPDALMSSCRASKGEARKVPGGYRASGTGVFSSGCLNADWVIVDGVPVEGERPITVCIPVEDLEILDTWRVVGLAGTGSHDVRFTDVFIPEHRTCYPGGPVHGERLDGPMFRTEFLGGPFALSAVVLGIAMGGLQQFIDITRNRSARGGGKVAEMETVQLRIGESAIELEGALLAMRNKLKELMATLSGKDLTTGRRPSVFPAGGTNHPYQQGVSTFVAFSAYRAMERLMQVAGANQMMLNQPLQRAFRDVLAGIQQPSNNWDSGRVGAGKALLAMPLLAMPQN